METEVHVRPQSQSIRIRHSMEARLEPGATWRCLIKNSGRMHSRRT